MTQNNPYCTASIKRLIRFCGMVLLVVFFFNSLATAATPVDSLKQLLTTAREDSNKVNLLNDLAWELKFDEPAEGRNLLDKAALLAQHIQFTKGEAQAFNNRGVLETIQGDYPIAIEFYQRSLVLREKLNDQKGLASLYNNMANILEEQGQYEDALVNLRQSLYIRETLGDTLRIARVSYSIALVYESMGDYFESLDYALTYLSIAERLGLDEEIANAHNILGNIKRELDRDQEALKHYQQSVAIYKQLDYQWDMGQGFLNIGNILGDLAEKNYKAEQFQEADSQFKEAFDYYQQALLIQKEQEDSSAISDIYNGIGVLFKDQGSYFKELKQPDSTETYLNAALNYFNQALVIRQKNEDQKGIMQVYNGIGDVYRRQKNQDEALKYTYEYLEIAKEIKDQKYLISAYKDLARVYDKMDKHKKAYKFRKKYDELKYEGLTESSIKQNARREARYGDSRKQLEIERQEKEIALRNAELKQAALWRNSLIGGAIGLLLLALLFYNRYRLKNKTARELAEKNEIIDQERQRSEALLLNILPADTAQELKQNGHALAQKYESVTVLFTDFKDFTNLASQMEPEQLVAELDECFKAFDDITTRYDIEKIKTIGDAYMCAGGLPKPSNDHALRVVKAAIEMQAFLEQQYEKRQAAGLPAFEARMGIHTGPVVAGIVGHKKFAYDIWGDAVNLAARMESSGEIRRINVSQSTYELIKDDFECEHRGKILAKNKGEIDMYFVYQSEGKEKFSKSFAILEDKAEGKEIGSTIQKKD